MNSALVVAIVTSIASAVVSITSVVVSAIITRLNSKSESARAKEAREAEDARAVAAREAEDRRLREAREAEARRRQEERDAGREAALARSRAERVAARWDAVRAVIETEAKVLGDPPLWEDQYRLELQSLSLLTHPDEANLRSALRTRGYQVRSDERTIEAIVRPEWWHPWVSEWAARPDEPMIYGNGDQGKVF